MFSFFKSKKTHSPAETPTNEHKASPADNDDYIFIAKKNEQELDDNKTGGPSSMYPVMDHFGVNPTMPYPPVKIQTQKSISEQASFVTDVPFKLSPGLAGSDDSSEFTRYQINSIMSSITTSSQTVERLDYDFKLERSLVN